MYRELRLAFNATKWKPTKEEILLSASAISRDERERIVKFRFIEDYKRSLIGRLLLRSCITKMLRIPWNEISLGRTDKGKPILLNELPADEKLFFNVSHAGDYVVLAASSSRNIGVDVMEFKAPNNKPIPKFLDTMRNLFTLTELTHIKSFKSEWSRLKAFYRLWTLKESWVKATGVGIGKDIAGQLDFRLGTRKLRAGDRCSDSVLWMGGEEVQGWCFHECLLDDRHVVSVACERDDEGPQDVTEFAFVSFADVTDEVAVVVEPCDETWWDEYDAKEYKADINKKP